MLPFPVSCSPQSARTSRPGKQGLISSTPSVSPETYFLCFDAHTKPSSRNSLLLILMQNPRGWGMPSTVHDSLHCSLSHSFAILDKSSRLVPTASALFAKTPGVYPNSSQCGTTSLALSGCPLRNRGPMIGGFPISSFPGTFSNTPAYLSTTARSSTTAGTRLGRLH